MNSYTKRFLIINIILFIIEIILIYLLINNILTNDFITPRKQSFYEYIIKKINNLIY